ncbi:MAG: hypothetical protein ABEJ22_05460 [Haloferacaceae archaeon]
MTRGSRFAVVVLAAFVLLAVLDILFVPPKPYLELLVLAPGSGAGFLAAYWVAYRR